MKEKSTVLILTGGLGNQLFQLSAALSATNRKILIEISIGNPRKSLSGEVELLSLNLPKRIELVENRSIFKSFLSRIYGYFLRSGIQPKRWEKNVFVKTFLIFIGSIVFSIVYRKPIKIFQSKDVGYNLIPNSKFNLLLIGYFQSYKWLSTNVRDEFDNIRIIDKIFDLSNFESLARAERPIIVHIRLGDYLNEPHFGIPGKNYYEKALARQASKLNNSKIWLFSNDLRAAIDFIPLEYKDKLRLIEEPDLSSAATLEIMKLGYAYILGNSSFSWWAAQLSSTRNPHVIAPDPWFKEIQAPKELIPDHWEKIESNWLKIKQVDQE